MCLYTELEAVEVINVFEPRFPVALTPSFQMLLSIFPPLSFISMLCKKISTISIIPSPALIAYLLYFCFHPHLY